MVASLLWTGGANGSPFLSIPYPAGTDGANPLMLMYGAGLLFAPNGGSVSEQIQFNGYRGAPHFFGGSTAGVSNGVTATHWFTANWLYQDEAHANFLDTGGNATLGGDNSQFMCAVAAIISMDDVILDGLGVVPPTIDGQTPLPLFSGRAIPNATVASPVGRGAGIGGTDGWSVHSAAGTFDGTGISVLSRMVSPFAVLAVTGHSNDTPPYGTPDFVGGLPSWTQLGWQQSDHYFAGLAFWTPPDPANPDYSYNLSGFPTCDFGEFEILTLNLPPTPTHPFAAMIG
jgi:hypothetical protein